MELVQPTPAELASAASRLTSAPLGPSADEVLAEIDAGRLRPEWSVLTIDDAGSVVGRAMWWGRDAEAAIALDVWDVAPQVADRGRLAAALVARGHELLAARGSTVPLPHTIRLPQDWRDDATLVAEVELVTHAAAAVGLTLVNERIQLQWDADRPLPPEPDSLMFEPADDDTFVRLFAEAAEGSLDVMTRRELASGTADDLARAEVEYYLACPGDRAWWRTAATADGTVVGVAIPSATPTNRNVGYVAVLPRHRGRGYVDQVLAFVTRFHAAQGAPRVTATTDAVNAPMAAAFRRAGYRCTKTRIDLEAP